MEDVKEILNKMISLLLDLANLIQTVLFILKSYFKSERKSVWKLDSKINKIVKLELKFHETLIINIC